MPAALFFNYLYSADASQTTTLTVSGESQDAGPSGAGTPDAVVVANIPAAELNSLMTVGAQGSTGVGYPAVTLDWTSLVSADPLWVNFLKVEGKDIDPVDFSDHFGTQHPTLQKVFSTKTFEFTTNSTNPLLTIPPEAIKDVDYSGPIELKRDASALSQVKLGGAASILGTATTAPNTDDISDSQQKAVRGLFLQAMAAGRYKQSPAKAPDSSDLPTDKSPGFDFEAGDTISVYTVFSLTKTRKFIPDTVDALEGTGGMKFKVKVDGSEVVVDGGDEDKVASDVKTWTVEWKLKVSA
jgi:hypothetical protein